MFTPNPYFAHPGTKTEENTELGRIRSEKYNQSVFVRMLDSIWNMLQCPYAPWEKSIRNHFASALPDKIQSIEKWINGNRPGRVIKMVHQYHNHNILKLNIYA